jgi:hypothetical protein
MMMKFCLGVVEKSRVLCGDKFLGDFVEDCRMGILVVGFMDLMGEFLVLICICNLLLEIEFNCWIFN